MRRFKNVNKSIYKGRVTQQIPSFVYEEYLQDGTFSPSTVAMYTVFASKSENYDFNKSELYKRYGRRTVDKAFKEMILSGHIVQVNYSLESNKRMVAVRFFTEPRSSSEVSRIATTILNKQLSRFPSAHISEDTMEFINKGIELQRDFAEAKRRMQRNSEGGWNIIVDETEEVIPCKEVPRINGKQVFYVPLEEPKHAPFIEETTEINEEGVMDSLLNGLYDIEGVKESPEFDSIKEGYAHSKQGGCIFTDIDGLPTNQASISIGLSESNFIVGKIYSVSEFSPK